MRSGHQEKSLQAKKKHDNANYIKMRIELWFYGIKSDFNASQFFTYTYAFSVVQIDVIFGFSSSW